MGNLIIKNKNIRQAEGFMSILILKPSKIIVIIENIVNKMVIASKICLTFRKIFLIKTIKSFYFFINS